MVVVAKVVVAETWSWPTTVAPWETYKLVVVVIPVISAPLESMANFWVSLIRTKVLVEAEILIWSVVSASMVSPVAKVILPPSIWMSPSTCRLARLLPFSLVTVTVVVVVEEALMVMLPVYWSLEESILPAKMRLPDSSIYDEASWK